MAKYVIEETKTSKYEKDFKLPLINLIPAIVWCIPVHQKVSPLVGTIGAYIAVAVFLVLYVLLSFVPIAAVTPGIASVIMMTAMLWAPADHIGNNVVRVIVIILVTMVLIEFCILINATLPWLQSNTNKPVIRKVE
jgi:hypothetical protein